MFEKASRKKLRFDYRGVCTVEDLWDIPFVGLDSIYKDLNAIKRDLEGDSLLGKPSENEELDLKIGIVKHVFDVRVEEREARKNEAERKEKKQRIMEIIARKQDDELLGKSVDELQSLLNDL